MAILVFSSLYFDHVGQYSRLHSAFLDFVGIFTVEVASNFAHPAYEAMLIDLATEENCRFEYTINYWLINVTVMMEAGIAGAFYDHHFFELLLVMTTIADFSYVIMFWKFQETRPEGFIFEHGKGLTATF